MNQNTEHHDVMLDEKIEGTDGARLREGEARFS